MNTNIFDKIYKNKDINFFNILILNFFFNINYFNVDIDKQFPQIIIIKNNLLEWDLNYNHFHKTIQSIWQWFNFYWLKIYEVYNVDWKYTIFFWIRNDLKWKNWLFKRFEYLKIQFLIKKIFNDIKFQWLKKYLIKIFEYKIWYIYEFQKLYLSFKNLQKIFDKKNENIKLIWKNILENKEESVYYVTLITYLFFWNNSQIYRNNFQIKSFDMINSEFHQILILFKKISYQIDIYNTSKNEKDLNKVELLKIKSFLFDKKFKIFKDEFEIQKLYIDEVFKKNWYYIHSNILSRYQELYNDWLKIENFINNKFNI